MALLFGELEKGHGAMLSKGGPGSGRHPEHKEKEQKAVRDVINEMKSDKMGRYAQTDPAPQEVGSSHEQGIRDFGTWVNSHDDDDEDSDHQRPTPETSARAREIISRVQVRHPDVKLSMSGGEKNWTYVHAEHKGAKKSAELAMINRAEACNFLSSETADSLRSTTALDAAAREARVISLANEVDVAVHAAATSPTNLRGEPTDGQKEAGNYKKGHVTISGLNLAIENPQGSTRYSHADVDPPWEVQMKDAHYGYLKGVVGQDKDHLDVFLKPGTDEDFSGSVFVVHQVDQKTGDFDEHKVMLGYASADAAISAYKANYPRDWTVGLVQTMSMPEFKTWTASGSVVQRTWGSRRPVAFAQPAPFLSKGGPGSGRHKEGGPGSIGDKARVAGIHADQASAKAHPSASNGHMEAAEAHSDAAAYHRAAAVHTANMGDAKQAAYHRGQADRHAIARQRHMSSVMHRYPAEKIAKDVTTGTGLSTPQAGLTHYDRKNKTDKEKFDDAVALLRTRQIR